MIIDVSNPWAAIVGRGPEGRNEMISDIAQRLRADGLSVRGFTHEGVEESSGPGIDAVELFGVERAAIARTSPHPDICNYLFQPAGFEAVDRWCGEDGDVLFMEIGRLEAKGEGYWPTVTRRFVGPRTLLVLSIRPHVLASIALDLPDPAAFIELPYDGEQAAVFAGELLAAWRLGQSN